MAINIHSVRLHLEENQWKLFSTDYKNLDTLLEMECPEGHKQQRTYKDWRKHMLCDKCLASDSYQIKKNKVPIKKIDTKRILALDAATNISGYSIYDDDVLVAYGTYKVNSSLDTTERINTVKRWLSAAIDEWQPDFVGIEHIQLQTFGAKNSPQVEMYRVLANLQGVLLDLLFEKNIECGLVYSTTWRKYCGIDGIGRENKKKAAQDKVQAWYGLKCTQDEADAICVGKYFSKNLNKPIASWGEDID